jgi:hypothetical protein
MNAPPGQIPTIDVWDVLSGAFDLRSYSRRYLVLVSWARERVNLSTDVIQHYGPAIHHLTNGIEWLEPQGWELVNVFSVAEANNRACSFAMMRRISSHTGGGAVQ